MVRRGGVLLHRDLWYPAALLGMFTTLMFAGIVMTVTDGYVKTWEVDPRLATSILVAAALTVAVFLRWCWLVLQDGRAEAHRGTAVLVVVGNLYLLYHDEWFTLALAVTVVVACLRPRVAAVVVIGSLTTLAVWVTSQQAAVVGISIGLTAGAVGMVLHAFVRLAVLVTSLQRAREELARARVDEERMRMQQDLHDMLGRTLVSASLRNQVALRTLGRDEDATRQHLDLLHTIIRDGQTRLRDLTSGPVVASLDEEVSSALALCDHIGLRCTVERLEVGDPTVERCAALVVREGMTNLLKHSRARSCAIAVTHVGDGIRVVVSNDGAPADADWADSAGTGLGRVRDAVEELGGIVRISCVRGTFTLDATIPQQR